MEPSGGRRAGSGMPHFQVIGRSPVPRSIDELLQEALQLPPEERARVGRALLASLQGEPARDSAPLANRLPLDDRLRFVQDIRDGIAATPEAVPVPDSHRRELDRRLDDPSPEPGLTWDEVRARLRDQR